MKWKSVLIASFVVAVLALSLYAVSLAVPGIHTMQTGESDRAERGGNLSKRLSPGGKAMPAKITYWVRSKQTNEIGGFGRRPVPAQFKNVEDARQYRRELNLRKGAFHPGYFIDKQDDSPVLHWPE
jgi:hypothetical protein